MVYPKAKTRTLNVLIFRYLHLFPRQIPVLKVLGLNPNGVTIKLPKSRFMRISGAFVVFRAENPLTRIAT